MRSCPPPHCDVSDVQQPLGAPQKLDACLAANQAVFFSRYSNRLSPFNLSLMRSWL